jgi:hypothetical protein
MYPTRRIDESSVTRATETPNPKIWQSISFKEIEENPSVTENSMPKLSYFRKEVSEKNYVDMGTLRGSIDLLSHSLIWLFDKKPTSETGIMVLRTHYSSEVIKALDWIGENHEVGDPGVSLHITKLFKNLLEAFDRMEGDPMVHFFISLYDSLAFQDKWLEVPSNTFRQVCQLVKNLNNQQLTVEKVDKAILKLAKMGLSVLPYFPDSDLEEEIWSNES